MSVKFYSFLKRLTLIIPILILAASSANAQCEWLQYAPYYVKPATTPYYEFECGTGNAVWITRCSTDKAIVNLNSTSGCPPVAGDTNNYNYFPGQLLKVNAGSKVDFYINWGFETGVSTNSLHSLSFWFDWNHNGIFEYSQFYSEQAKIKAISPTTTFINPSGLVAYSTATLQTGKFQIEVEIPSWAKNGPTRLRVRSSAAGLSPNLVASGVGPCDHSKFGEIEEYDVDIVNPCLSPKVISISNVTCNSADVCWSTQDNADLYDYWVDTCRTPGCSIPSFDPTIKNYFDIKTQNCITLPNNKYPLGLPQLLPETKYYVLVRSICDTIRKPTSQYWQVSDWNAIDSFTTLPCCDAPLNVRMSEITSTTATATWDPVYTSTKYEYTVMTTPGPQPSAGTKTFNTYAGLQGLTSAKTYYFCVRALCTPTPLSNWSCVPFSTENTLGIGNLATEGPEVSVYPNPVKNIVTVSVEKANKGALVTITDVAGRVVYTQGMDTEKAEINMSGWNAGLYFVKYVSEAGNKTVKVIKE